MYLCMGHVIRAYFSSFTRGSLEDGKDLELQCVRAGVHVFVEKPLSLLKSEDFQTYVDTLKVAQEETGAIVSVGYMFRLVRYEFIDATGKPVLCAIQTVMSLHTFKKIHA